MNLLRNCKSVTSIGDGKKTIFVCYGTQKCTIKKGDVMKYLNKFYLDVYYNSDNEGFYPYNVFYDKDLTEIDFSDITIFYGSNGSGKSTLLNIIIKELNKEREVIKASRVKTNEIEMPEYEKYRSVNIDDFVQECESELIDKIPIGSELISSKDI